MILKKRLALLCMLLVVSLIPVPGFAVAPGLTLDPEMPTEVAITKNNGWDNRVAASIASLGITGDANMIEQERRKIRDGLAALTETDGLLGKITRVQDEGEALKPYVFVQAQSGSWNVIHDPR